MKNFKVVCICSKYPYVYEISNEHDNFTCYMISSPFGNCQNSAINNFSELLYHVDNLELNLEEVLQDIQDQAGSRRATVVIDILESTYEQIGKRLKFINTMSYTNTNTDSKMRMCIVDLRRR